MAVYFKNKNGTTRKSKLKGKSSIQYDKKTGVPMAEPPRLKSVAGTQPPPDTEGKAYLEKEKVLAQAEILLLKGISTPTSVAATLSVSYPTAKRYIEQVHYRWAILGERSRIRQVRGAARARLSLITNELWVTYANTTDERVKVAAINQLLAVHDRELLLDGITPKVVEELRSRLLSETREGHLSAADRIGKHNQMRNLSDALAKYISDKTGDTETEIIDITPGSDGS